MAEIVKLGSLYLDGQPKKAGAFCITNKIALGGTVLDYELQWVKLSNGLLIADRSVCVNVSWKQLNDAGLVFGTPVTIDGETYLCRCLKVGAEEGEPNEWDTALDEAGRDTSLWHWGDDFFWGQEVADHNELFRALRGYYAARGRGQYTVSYRDDYLGFRPALEHLDSGLCHPEMLLGKTAKVYCSDGISIEGCLVDFSDYDVVLKTSSLIPADSAWAAKDGYNIIISRGNITFMKEK